jgi:hypothetical protein
MPNFRQGGLQLENISGQPNAIVDHSIIYTDGTKIKSAGTIVGDIALEDWVLTQIADTSGSVTVVESSGGSIIVQTIPGGYNLEVASAPIQDHNDLMGLQGGDVDEYYHLSESQYNDFIGKTEVANISGDLQDQIDNIVQESTSIVGGDGISVIESPIHTFAISVSGDYATNTFVDEVSGSLQDQIDALPDITVTEHFVPKGDINGNLVDSSISDDGSTVTVVSPTSFSGGGGLPNEVGTVGVVTLQDGCINAKANVTSGIAHCFRSAFTNNARSVILADGRQTWRIANASTTAIVGIIEYATPNGNLGIVFYHENFTSGRSQIRHLGANGGFAFGAVPTGSAVNESLFILPDGTARVVGNAPSTDSIDGQTEFGAGIVDTGNEYKLLGFTVIDENGHYVEADGSYYFGPEDVDGSLRVNKTGDDLQLQKRILGVWTNISLVATQEWVETLVQNVSGDLQDQIDIINTSIDGITGGLDQLDTRFVNVTGDTMTGNLELPTIDITNHADFTSSVTSPDHQEGRVFYCDEDKTLCYYNENADVKVNIGQETLIRVLNKTGLNIPNGKVVYINGAFAAGNRVTIDLADATDSSTRVIGVTTCSISDDQSGYVTTEGLVRDVNTNGFTVGETIYLDPLNPGELTNVMPDAPNRKIQIGIVVKVGTTDGIIFVRIFNGESVGELHDVTLTTPVSGDILRYNGSIWENSDDFTDLESYWNNINSASRLYGGCITANGRWYCKHCCWWRVGKSRRRLGRKDVPPLLILAKVLNYLSLLGMLFPVLH